MASLADVVCHSASSKDEFRRGAVLINHKMLFVSGGKRRTLTKQICPPEEPEPGFVRLRFAEDDWCELRFVDSAASGEFAAQCLSIFEAAAKRGSRPQGAVVPGVGEERAERPCGQPAKAVRRRTEAMHDFEMMSQQSHLPKSTYVESPPAGDAYSREAKRRTIDSHCITGTPEKVGRTSLTPIRRAPGYRSSILSFGGRSIAPQRSASYQGYRSSLTFGLKNLGNTCYLNAVMQACCSLRELVADLRAMAGTLPPCKEGELYRRTVEMLQQMTASAATGPLNPTRLREHIALASPMFRGNAQQDAHEFLLEFINQLHDELLGARNQWLKQAPEHLEDTAVLATQLHLDSEIQKRLVCVQCQQPREVSERFRDFSLDFCGHEGGDRCSLSSMLKAYFDSELLEVKCEHCGAVAAHMVKQLTSAPRVLVLHLKRFIPNLEKQRYDKRHQSVEIPTRLDLNAVLGGANAAASAEGRSPPRLPARPLASTAAAASSGGATRSAAAIVAGCEPGTGSKAGAEADATRVSTEADASTSRGPAGLCYDLRAVVAHDGGSPQSGHYTCYAHGEDGTWRLYDDSIVREVASGQELQRALGRSAYIVFYVVQAHAAKA